MKKATFNADAEGRRFLAYHIHNGSLRGLEPNIEGGRAEKVAIELLCARKAEQSAESV